MAQSVEQLIRNQQVAAKTGANSGEKRISRSKLPEKAIRVKSPVRPAFSRLTQVLTQTGFKFCFSYRIPAPTRLPMMAAA